MIARYWLLLFPLILLTVSPAAAAPMTFSFTGNAGNVPSIVQTQGGTTLTVTPIASSLTPLLTITSTALSQNATLGIGVTWSGTMILFGNPVAVTDPDPQVNNLFLVIPGYNEAVQFAFSGNGPWRIDSITLSATTNFIETLLGLANESFVLSVNGNPVPLGGLNPFGNNGIYTINLSSIPETQRIGTLFVVSPAGFTDDFRIVALQVTAMPEPATVGILGLSLLGLAGYRRRQRT